MLSAAFSADFEPYDAGQIYRGLIVLSEDEELVRAAAERNISFYQLHCSNPRTSPKPSTIKFAESADVHRAFRGAALPDASLEQFNTLPMSLEVLAEVDGQAVWSVERANGCHHVGVPLPSFAENDFFHSHFRGSRWFAMVPLLHFLRSALGPKGWQVAKPRATFIIDDPNFHHRSYGFIDFAKLIKHAETHNYHATVATVPLDTWYFNRKVVALFRAHQQQISVMMHGVNHLADELGRQYPEEEALSLLAVGLRRIAAFEARSGLRVERIMAAPHGAYKESMAEPMLRLGFEAGCVSIGSLTHWNARKNWAPDLGIPMAQVLGRQAFPVFHRTSTNETDIRLSAFLGHPVVIATHHHDYISNFTRIESLAKMVNQISSPQWMSVEDISRTNYLSSVENGVLCVTPYARRLRIAFSEDINAIRLMASPFCPEVTISLAQRSTEDAISVDGVRLETRVLNDVMELFIPPRDPVDYEKVAPIPLGLWAVTRRLLAEARDRAVPVLSFATPH